MKKVWSDESWEEYLYWQAQDRKTLKRINKLILDIERNGTHGIGKPELLKGDLSGLWSVRIDEKNRLVFWIADDTLKIAQCGTHYGGR
ncbi:addiction module protein [Anaerolineaceae bacterium oral taxon 439]|mgnify:FL=1|nr:addiction module protein [Anaerolineaceae bacterium oral taxon 439]